jgi:hypothetical protein
MAGRAEARGFGLQTVVREPAEAQMTRIVPTLQQEIWRTCSFSLAPVPSGSLGNVDGEKIKNACPPESDQKNDEP